jgi:hypothetical protein
MCHTISPSSIVVLHNVSHNTKVELFHTIVAAVDEASSAKPPETSRHADRRFMHEGDAPCALWWDLTPLKHDFTSSIEELFDTILSYCKRLQEWMSIQQKFDQVCLALTKQSGHRISLLILENAQILERDASVYGRWMLLMQIIASGGCAAKVVCLHEEERRIFQPNPYPHTALWNGKFENSTILSSSICDVPTSS